MTEVPVSPDTTNKLSPKGGVMKPTPREVTMTMQKWMSSNPISCARGRRIGDKITMFGVVSMTHPATIRIPMMIKVKITGSSVKEVMT